MTAQIKKAESELEKSENIVKLRDEKLKEYQNCKNPKSPQYYINKINEMLKSANGWAYRDSIARGLRQNSRVNNDTYKKFIGLTPNYTKDKLIIEFNNKLKELEEAKSGAGIINIRVPVIPDNYKNYQNTLANELIRKKIKEPTLSDREKYLLSLVTTGKADELQTRIDYLSDENNTFCPYCLQDLAHEYKNDLAKRIQYILTDELKHHQSQLTELKITELELDISPFSILPQYKACEDLITTINDILRENNKLLQIKIEDSYSPIIDEKICGIEDKIQSLEQALKILEQERINHNNKTKTLQPIMDEMISINDDIAYYDVINYSEQHNTQAKEMSIAKKEYENAVADRDDKKKFLEELNRRKKIST